MVAGRGGQWRASVPTRSAKARGSALLNSRGPMTTDQRFQPALPRRERAVVERYELAVEQLTDQIGSYSARIRKAHEQRDSTEVERLRALRSAFVRKRWTLSPDSAREIEEIIRDPARALEVDSDNG
jgi:hypothetical protein